jgi:biotin carboxylase
MQVLKGKKLLILGGIALSCEIVRHAKRMGIEVYVTDYLPDSPAKKIADKSFMVSATDVDALAALIEKENIDGVITGFVDMLLPYYQQVCELTGKPCYATIEQIEILTNKDKFKQLCRQFNVPVVEEYKLDLPLTMSKIVDLSYPVLLKPTDNSGGKGIFICDSPDELMVNYEKSLAFSPGKHVLIERYMTAKEASVFYLFQDGEVFLTAMGERHVKHFQNGIIPLPVAYSFPSLHLREYQNTVQHRVVEMFKAIGMKNGMVFIQTFVENGKCIFYEIGYRLTGSLEYKLIAHACGFDPMDMMIRFALTGKMSNTDPSRLANPDFKSPHFNITLLARPGKIGKIQGIDEAKKIPGVLDVFCSYAVGDEIPTKALGTLAQVIIRVFGFSESRNDLANLMNLIQGSIKVYNQAGEYMLLPMFETSDLIN